MRWRDILTITIYKVSPCNEQTLERSECVQFTIPLIREVATLIAPATKGSATNFWVYKDIFPNEVWIACAATLLAAASGFALMRACGVDRFHVSSDSEKFTLLNGLGVSGLMLLQLSYDIMTKGSALIFPY